MMVRNLKYEVKEKTVSVEVEGPTTGLLLRVWEASNPRYEGSLKIEEEGQDFYKNLPSLSGQNRWEGALSSKGYNQYVHLCFKVWLPFLLLIRPFSNISYS